MVHSSCTQNCIASDVKQTNRSSNMGDPLSLWILATGGGSSKSDVWKHFTKTTKKKVVTCNVCSREFAYHRGTSNLHDHLQRSHPDIYKNLGEKQQNLHCDHAEVFWSEDESSRWAVVTMDIRPLAIFEILHSVNEFIHNLFVWSHRMFESGNSPFVPPLNKNLCHLWITSC